MTAGWRNQAARRIHNPKVIGSNPIPATNFGLVMKSPDKSRFLIRPDHYTDSELLGFGKELKENHSFGERLVDRMRWYESVMVKSGLALLAVRRVIRRQEKLNEDLERLKDIYWKEHM